MVQVDAGVDILSFASVVFDIRAAFQQGAICAKRFQVSVGGFHLGDSSVPFERMDARKVEAAYTVSFDIKRTISDFVSRCSLHKSGCKGFTSHWL